MDRHDEYFKFFYEDLRSDFGDTEYTADFANDLANEQVQEDIRHENARQEAWEDALVDYRADGEIATVRDNKRANNPLEASGVSGGVAISVLGALGSPAAIVGLGLGVLGVYVLYKCLSNDDAQTSSNDTSGNSGAPSVNEHLDSLEETVDRLRKQVEENEATLSRFELPKLEAHNFGHLKSHLKQPGSMFYLSTEYNITSLDAHFGRFKDPKHIDMFIRGETRTKVLEMAELWKVAIA